MKKKAKILVGNWKMNPKTPEEANQILLGIRRKKEYLKGVDVVVCPPAVYLPLAVKHSTDAYHVGSQGLFWETSGAYTGRISAGMVATCGATYAIIGHSEERAAGDTDETVNKKVIASMNAGLTSILCIGEKERLPDGAYLEFIRNQIKNGLAKIQRKNLDKIIIAYEPLWAIGKSEVEAMKGRELHEMHIFIRKVISEIYGKDYAFTVPVLYGGSVTPANAAGIVSEGQVQGLLVGRQSLDPKSFIEIARLLKTIN